MKTHKENIIITPKVQLEIFEIVFLHMLEYQSMRDKLRGMIESRDRVDAAWLNLELKKLEAELTKEGG